ncbi:sorbosone dehydrogenase family protein [Promicromonospora sp. Populi]|uniref:PQQ-dependent sugar dehydrogenase n=1 Tax=Promicromonospora sp. Populi TaxID=3239420 RepID=UPI0034E2268F
MLVGSLAGCTAGTTGETPPAASPPASSQTDPAAGIPLGEPSVLAEGITGTPWELVVMDSGSSLVSFRDTGSIGELTENGEVREVATIGDAVIQGTSGVLGIALLEGAEGEPTYLYAFYTADDSQRIVRAPLTGTTGSYALGAFETVLDGIPRGERHNAGRIAFGPDGMLYAATGDPDQEHAQDPESLAGKILRLTPEGEVPGDNPTAGSYVYSLGHRNIEGLAWSADGTMWASEFGEDAWDELNEIVPGGNYGWPEIEGEGGAPDFIDPVLTWSVADASPAGIAVVDNTVFMANLRGESLMAIDVSDPAGATFTTYFRGEFGRLREVDLAPDGESLLVLTSNSDSNGEPREGDERLLSVPLETAAG